MQKSLHEAHPHAAGQSVGKTEERGVSGRGQSRSVYLLFSSGLMAQECLALLNWALRTHTAALKLPDG